MLDSKFSLVTIAFKPPEEVSMSDSVSILGEFNKWLPELMNRFSTEQICENPSLANKFYYRCQLMKGFKYSYHFSVGD